MVLVLGFAATQTAAARKHYPKPTFLPLYFNARLTDAPLVGDTSGVDNLNYLTDPTPFDVDLEIYNRLIPFDSALVIADVLILDAFAATDTVLNKFADTVELSGLGYKAGDMDIASKIPDDVQAVILGPLPRLSQAQLKQFLEQLSDRGIAVFAGMGRTQVELGALATDAVELDFVRTARKMALNMQAVLLGARAGDQSVTMEGKRQLIINMETARRIGLSPRFDVLSEAVLLNAEPEAQGLEVDFRQVADMALARSLDIEAGRLGVDAGSIDVGRAHSALLPQLTIAASLARRDDDPALRSVGTPEGSTDGALTLNQMLYSDSVVSTYQQQKHLHQALVFGQSALQLDTIAEALSAYLQALRAEIQLKIQQDNLEMSKSNLDLARDRVRIGSSSAADVYRWQSNVANARTAVLLALSSKERAHDNLNRILNLPVHERLRLRGADVDEPFVMTEADYNALITNPRSFRWFAEFMVAEGLRLSPELAQLDAQVDAARRNVKEKSRARWLPDFTLQAQYTDNLNQYGVGSGPPLEGADDWSVLVNASLPLFAGGRLRADLSKATLSLAQLEVQREALADRIEQNIWAGVHAAQSSYSNIELFEASAEAARNNLELVTDGYRRGTVNIIELLDAQTQSVQANLNANNAVYDFLLDVVDLQRASGQFEFLLSSQEQSALNHHIRQYIKEREQAFRENRQ